MKVMRIIMATLLAVACYTVVCFAEDSPKIGPNGEIIIQNAEQLAHIQGLATLYMETEGKQGTLEYLTCPLKLYVLDNDIDLPANWIPIGDISSNSEFVFRGSFDGRGYTIRGLLIEEKPQHVQGLFGKVEGANISNLILENAVIRLEKNSTETIVGLLAGEAYNCRFRNIKIINGAVFADDQRIESVWGGSDYKSNGAIGGFVGRIVNSMVESVYVTANINVSSSVAGGVAGHSVDTRFYHSGTDGGTVTGQGTVGGFIGRLEGTGPVLGCRSSADVTGGIVGGFIGQVKGPRLPTNANHTLEIFQNKATGKTVSTGKLAGGFAGEVSYALIKDCTVYGDVSGGTIIGGFVGELNQRSRVIYGYAKGEVNGQIPEGTAHKTSKITDRAMGGFAGEIAGAACIEFSYSSGSVFANYGWEGAVGGFVGVISDVGAPNSITHCLSFAPWVIGTDYVHRFAGRAKHQGINGCYAHLGSQVVRDGELAHVVPSAYGADGADMSSSQVESVAKRLGWKEMGLP